MIVIILIIVILVNILSSYILKPSFAYAQKVSNNNTSFSITTNGQKLNVNKTNANVKSMVNKALNTYLKGNQGGSSQGGRNQGGSRQGGRNQGGSSQGGRNQGGSSQGGRNQGGSNQGGRNQGGSNQGGRNQGGVLKNILASGNPFPVTYNGQNIMANPGNMSQADIQNALINMANYQATSETSVNY